MRLFSFFKCVLDLAENAWYHWERFIGKLLELLLCSIKWLIFILVEIILWQVLRVEREKLVGLDQCILWAGHHLVVHFKFDWLDQSDSPNSFLAHAAWVFLIYLRRLIFDLLSAVSVRIVFFGRASFFLFGYIILF
jgi:hypothetical protein